MNFDVKMLEAVGPVPNKPILCLDFDGVLHGYQSGWREAYFIPDPPVPGAMAFLVDAVRHFTVVVFSSRSHQDGGIPAMAAWVDYWLDMWVKSQAEGDFVDKLSAANGVRNQIRFAASKPSAMVTIDDRAITFDGTWPSIETLKNFKPWNKK